MRLNVIRSPKGVESLYITRDTYLGSKPGPDGKPGKKRTTSVYKKLGRVDVLMKEKNMSHDEVIQWARDHAKELTEQEKSKDLIVPLYLHTGVQIPLNEERSFNCGYLFLQNIYYGMKVNNICRNIKQRYKYEFSLDAILSDLVYARILEPCSKRASYQYCRKLLEPPKYSDYDVYRALSVLAKECDYIQAELYKNSNLICSRNNRILYYDCTNYYFEIEEDDDLRKYGKSKENRPNPIVQMGLFMDGNGIPLAFNVFPGNQNEQPSMTPLEQKIIRTFGFEKFVVCTDGGLGSDNNRAFNDIEGRAFIVTQSLKKLKEDERKSAMDDRNWKKLSNGESVDINEIIKEPEKHTKELYYKEDVYGTKKVPGQLMIVTYSPKYALYQKKIRGKQIERAEAMIKSGKKKSTHKNPNDPARFVKKTSVTKDGEAADKTLYELDDDRIAEEKQYDGFYAVCTNLVEEDVKAILEVSEGRWEIEESFRIMKTDFRARPVYLSREDRICAHFLTCFMALLIFRILEHKLGGRYTSGEIIDTLREMRMISTEGGYQPAYKRTELTDSLHEIFGFHTDYQIIPRSDMRSIIKNTKKL